VALANFSQADIPARTSTKVGLLQIVSVELHFPRLGGIARWPLYAALPVLLHEEAAGIDPAGACSAHA
jgi:hypothetical protein